MIGIVLGLLCLFSIARAELTNNHKDCEFWASIGECDKNPSYMLSSCAKACFDTSSVPETSIESFYDIVETDLNGSRFSFNIFRGKVVYIVNVASQCGYTAENYATFRSLKKYRPQGLEIVLAPCNQFGKQEPGDALAIQGFANSQRFDGIILAKADVNGGNTRPSFEYLKHSTNKKSINWNFDGKFLVDRAGRVSVPSDDVEADIRRLLSEHEL